MNPETSYAPFTSAAAGGLASDAAGSQADGAATDDGDGAHPFAADDEGRYERRATLGAGGMGTVELAFDRRLLREVALKNPRRDDADAARRLAQEAWITAQLDHPGIVPVYDAGRHPDGSLFYTMRVIRGRSLEDELARAPDLAARLRFVRHFLAACEATAYAHGLGIVHRDLKPQNILVGELGETQVADWGVARPTATSIGQAWREAIIPDGHAVETLAGSLLGTPAYMSPEQSVGAPADPRADVWSLGAILYRVLAGQPPFPGTTASEVVEAVRHGSVPSLSDEAPRELAAIALRCLARDPAARYPSARELAVDVASWLDGRRVSAHSYSRLELLRRLVRAYRVPLAVAGVALVVLIVGGLVAMDRVVSERDRAELTLARSLVAQAEREDARGQWPEAALLAAEALARAELPEARGNLAAGDRPHARLVAAKTLPCPIAALDPTGRLAVCAGPPLSLWEVSGEPRRLWERPFDARATAFEDAATLVVADREAKIHRLGEDGRELQPPIDLELVHGLAAGPGATLVAHGWNVDALLAGATRPLTATICALHRSVRLLVVGAHGALVAACDDGSLASSHDGLTWSTVDAGLGVDDVGLVGALTPDERTLAMLTDKGRLALVAWPDGTLRARVETGLRGVRAVAFDDDGARLAVASLHGSTRVLDARDGRELERLPRDLGRGVRWIGGELEARGETRLERWALPSTAVLPVVGAARAGVATIAVSGDLVALGRGQGQLDVYRADGERVAALALGDQTVKHLDFSPDGRRLYAVGPGSVGVAVHARGDGWPVVSRLGALSYRRVGALADGRVVAASWTDGPEIFAPDGTRAYGRGRGEPPVFELEVAPDRRFALLLEETTDAVRILDRDLPRELCREPGAQALGASRDRVAIGARGRVRVVDLDGAERLAVDLPGVTPTDLAFSPDGALLAVAGLDGATRVLDAAGHVVAVLRGHEERVAQLATTDDALYTASWDGSARRWGWHAMTAAPAALLDGVRADTGLDLPRALGRER